MSSRDLISGLAPAAIAPPNTRFFALFAFSSDPLQQREAEKSCELKKKQKKN